MGPKRGSVDRMQQVQIRIGAVGNVPRLHLDTSKEPAMSTQHFTPSSSAKLKLLHDVFEVGFSRRRIGRHHVTPRADFRDRDPGIGEGLSDRIDSRGVPGLAIRTEGGCVAKPVVFAGEDGGIVGLATSGLAGNRIYGGNTGQDNVGARRHSSSCAPEHGFSRRPNRSANQPATR